MPLEPTDITLTDQDRKVYHEQGYWISPVLFDAAEVGVLRREVERICAGERDYDGFYWLQQPAFVEDDLASRQVNNGWWVNQAIRRAVLAPVIGHIGAGLMDTQEVRVWHDQVLWKPSLGADGKRELSNNIGWHQDYAHWQCANTSNFCTAWVALQDTDECNGCMRLIAGSHQWGFRPDANTFGEKDLQALRAKYTPEDGGWDERPCVLKAGQVSFHHALTLHGSGPNLSNDPRLSLVVHMMPQDCGFKPSGRYHPNADLLGPFVKEDDLFAGPYFPRVWPEAD